MSLSSSTPFADIAALIGKGNGFKSTSISAASASSTGASTGSGNIGLQILYNSTSTLYSSLFGIPFPPGNSSIARLTSFGSGGNRIPSLALVRAYVIGTVNLATGTFTHDTATLPILKTQMGTSLALNLTPIIQVTTAPATAAPVFTMSYTSDTGASVTGSKAFTLPSATTVVGSSYLMRLENGDCGVRDITAMSFSVTASAGAATLWGVEQFAIAANAMAAMPTGRNLLTQPGSIPNITAGAATTGTATSLLAPLFLGGSGSTIMNVDISGFMDI